MNRNTTALDIFRDLFDRLGSRDARSISEADLLRGNGPGHARGSLIDDLDHACRSRSLTSARKVAKHLLGHCGISLTERDADGSRPETTAVILDGNRELAAATASDPAHALVRAALLAHMKAINPAAVPADARVNRLFLVDCPYSTNDLALFVVAADIDEARAFYIGHLAEERDCEPEGSIRFAEIGASPLPYCGVLDWTLIPVSVEAACESEPECQPVPVS
ncbi:hypothetical protein [Defluviimonas salinarum]|uniref:Uncharacterized protein n=1 Tax=Defluviimonas salinarum TaxID=2992147 RepID=A0ABT3J9T8_9RHOB|nr:hypothetical protein [Defluviimonas salinarum]MCW3784436.1 hypothetical protein [Defluviimonas salinarum]